MMLSQQALKKQFLFVLGRAPKSMVLGADPNTGTLRKLIVLDSDTWKVPDYHYTTRIYAVMTE